MKFHRIAAALIFLGTGSLPAMAQTRVVELSYEAWPAAITLPRSAAGELEFQACATCKVLRLRANEYTRYQLGKEDVTLAEMARYLTQHPNASLVVMQPTAQLVLSRLVVTSATVAK